MNQSEKSPITQVLGSLAPEVQANEHLAGKQVLPESYHPPTANWWILGVVFLPQFLVVQNVHWCRGLHNSN
jgi:hypothetical protein